MNSMRINKRGFTLIELMVVIVIMGILVTIGTFAFQSSQKKSRDARRKSDLSQVAKALEMYNSDVGTYPATGSGVDAGKIVGCDDVTKVVCPWGKIFSNTTKAIYMVKLPIDPLTKQTYYYEPMSRGYRLYARLENLDDVTIPIENSREYDVQCGVGTTLYCNYVLTSSNVVEPTPRP